jgi:CMD domain protein
MDVIDTLSRIAAGSRLDELRAHRPAAREQAQATYDALFSPIDDGAMSLLERHAVAAFVAALFDVPAAEQHYARLLADADPAIAAAVTAAVELGRGAGPYGSFGGELVAESQAGPELILTPPLADALGVRLTAALQHAHLLALHPRDSARERLQPLVDAGWSADGVVTLSQLVSFLAFQVRVVAGLTILAAEGSH